MVSSLPTEAVEWKRSYGRTSKSVYVEAEFHPIDVEALLKVSFNIEMHTPYNNKAREAVFRIHIILIWIRIRIRIRGTFDSVNRIFPIRH